MKVFGRFVPKAHVHIRVEFILLAQIITATYIIILLVIESVYILPY